MTDNSIVRYLRETRAELSKVSWPSRQEAWNLTLVVLATVLLSSIVLGASDYAFGWLLSLIIGIN